MMNIESLEDCIKDLKRATKNNYPSLFREVLDDIEMRCKCYKNNCDKHTIEGGKNDTI